MRNETRNKEVDEDGREMSKWRRNAKGMEIKGCKNLGCEREVTNWSEIRKPG